MLQVYIDAAAEDHADKDDERPNIYFTYSCLSSADLYTYDLGSAKIPRDLFFLSYISSASIVGIIIVFGLT